MASLAEGVVLFDSAPREVGSSREYVRNNESLRKWILENNGVSDCWISCFQLPIRRNRSSWGDAVYKMAVFDKIPLDTDIDQGYECIKLFHAALSKQGILHRIDFSGRTTTVARGEKAIGFHIFIPIVKNVVHKEQALKNVADYFNEYVKRLFFKEYGTDLNCTHCGEKCPEVLNKARGIFQQLDGKHGKLGVGKEKDCLQLCPYHCEPFDQIVKKVALAGMTRYPNTLNIGRHRFCIPLTEQQIEELDPFEIAELAKTQNFQKEYWMGDHAYIIPKRFDVAAPERADVAVDVPKIEPTFDILKRKKISYCISSLLTISKMDWEQRFWAIVCMRDLGLLPEECDNILRGVLEPEFYHHCTAPSPGEDMINRCYFGSQKTAYIKGGCELMRRISTCDPNCKKSHPIYL